MVFMCNLVQIKSYCAILFSDFLEQAPHCKISGKISDFPTFANIKFNLRNHDYQTINRIEDPLKSQDNVTIKENHRGRKTNRIIEYLLF